MRCYCCDCELSDYESTLRSATTGQFLDMCTSCISASEIIPVSFSRSSQPTIQDETLEFEGEETNEIY